MTEPKTDLALWLDFIRAFLWPGTVMLGLLMFRSQIKSLLTRVSSFKVGDTEWAFQPPSTDAAKSPPLDESTIVDDGFETFLTETGIRTIIKETGQLDAHDEIYRAMQIFSTQNQTTWIVFSRKKIFCVLDDPTTRKSRRLVQWSLSKDMAFPIKAKALRPGVGLLDIGTQKNWLYSTRLFSSPEILEDEVKSAISENI